MDLSINSIRAPSLNALATQRLQAVLATEQIEAASGHKLDIGVHDAPRASIVLNLRAQKASLDAFASSNALVATRLQAAQSSIDNIRTAFDDLAAQATAGARADLLQHQAEAALTSATGMLDGVVGGMRIFRQGAIDETASSFIQNLKARFDADFTTQFGIPPAIADATSMSQQDLEAFQLREISVLGSVPSNGDASVRISPNEEMHQGLGLDEPAISRALATLVVTIGTPAASSAVGSAGLIQSFATASGALADFQTTLGLRQSTLTRAIDTNQAASISLDSAISKIADVDPYEVATSISRIASQIEASYRLTAQLRDLSLAKYL